MSRYREAQGEKQWEMHHGRGGIRGYFLQACRELRCWACEALIEIGAGEEKAKGRGILRGLAMRMDRRKVGRKGSMRWDVGNQRLERR